MRVLYTMTSYPPAIGGAQLQMHQVARELVRRHEVRVVTMWDSNRTDWLLGTTVCAPPASRDYTVDGISVHRPGFAPAERLAMLPPATLYYLAQGTAIRLLARSLERKLGSIDFQPDLVHNGRIGREPLSYSSMSLARKRGVPFLLTPFHHPRWHGWWYRSYIRLYREADGLIALTAAEKDLLAQLGAPSERIFVTGMGPVLSESHDPGAFTEQHGVTGPLVLFLGQHYAYKGYRHLLRAAGIVWHTIPDAQFVFIGPPVGNSEDYFREVDDPRIRRLGSVDLQTKTDALAACDVLCVPSLQESFGGVYTEAWAFGKPVVGCDIPAVREVVEDGVNGFLVAQDPGDIAERICHLLLNPSLATRMGQSGRRKLEAHYTWDQIAARTEGAYRQVLQASAGSQKRQRMEGSSPNLETR